MGSQGDTQEEADGEAGDAHEDETLAEEAHNHEADEQVEEVKGKVADEEEGKEHVLVEGKAHCHEVGSRCGSLPGILVETQNIHTVLWEQETHSDHWETRNRDGYCRAEVGKVGDKEHYLLHTKPLTEIVGLPYELRRRLHVGVLSFWGKLWCLLGGGRSAIALRR